MHLPDKFSELEHFVEQWDHADTNARYAARLASSMEEMQRFFSAVLERAEDIKAYLDSIEFVDYSEADKCLARLMFAFSIVAGAVEIYRQPGVPDSGATRFEMITEPEVT